MRQMGKKWKAAGALFPLKDRVTVWRLIIASYVGFLLVWALDFHATSSISISAIMTLPYGATVTNTKSYVRKRMLAQIIGVLVAYPLYLFFNWVPHLHASQRLALPMTLSLIITTLINRGLRLNIADITMLMPGYLVILMTPGYDLYPLMRPIYVLLGVVLGYGLNVWFFAPNYGRIIDELPDKAGERLARVMDGYDGGAPDPSREADLDEATQCLKTANDYLPRLKQDLRTCKKYRPYLQRLPSIEQRIAADEAAISVLRGGLPGGEDRFARDYQTALSALFDRHQQLLRGETPEPREIACPIGSVPAHAAPAARLLRYMEALFCGPVPSCSPSGPALEEEPFAAL